MKNPRGERPFATHELLVKRHKSTTKNDELTKNKSQKTDDEKKHETQITKQMTKTTSKHIGIENQITKEEVMTEHDEAHTLEPDRASGAMSATRQKDWRV